MSTERALPPPALHAGHVIARRLRELHKKRKWLAEQVGVSAMSVTKWCESGKISRENIPRVADALGISAEELLRPTAPAASPESLSVLATMCQDKQLAIRVLGEAMLHIEHNEIAVACKLLRDVAAGIEVKLKLKTT